MPSASGSMRSIRTTSGRHERRISRSLRCIRRRPGQVASWLNQQFQELCGIPVVVDDQHSGRHVQLPLTGKLY